jgi:hypothetical protein
MAKPMGFFRDSQVPSWLFGPWTEVPAKTPSHRPWLQPLIQISSILCKLH